MLTRTRECYTWCERVLLDLGNVSVNRRIFINIYNIIYAHTFPVSVGTRRCKIRFFFLYFSSWRFHRNNNDVYLEIVVDILLPSKLFMETKAIEWRFLILLRFFIFFLFFARSDRYARIGSSSYSVSEKRAFGWRLFMKGNHGRAENKRKRISDCRRFFLNSIHFWF